MIKQLSKRISSWIRLTWIDYYIFGHFSLLFKMIVILVIIRLGNLLKSFDFLYSLVWGNSRIIMVTPATGVSQSWRQLRSFDHPLFSAVSFTTGMKSWRKNMKGARRINSVLVKRFPFFQSCMPMGLMSKRNSFKRPWGRLKPDESSPFSSCFASGESLSPPSNSFVMATSK